MGIEVISIGSESDFESATVEYYYIKGGLGSHYCDPPFLEPLFFLFYLFFRGQPLQRDNYLFYRRAGPVDVILFILFILFIFLWGPWGRKRDNYLFYCPPAGSWPISLRNP